MSNFKNFGRINNDNKRSCSKYLNSFLSDSNLNEKTENQVIKRQKLDPDVRFTSCNDKVNFKKQDESNTNSVQVFKPTDNNAETSCSNKFMSSDNTINTTDVQSKSNVYLDDDDEWFQDFIADVDEKCSQAEADSSSKFIPVVSETHSRIDVSSKFVNSTSKVQIGLSSNLSSCHMLGKFNTFSASASEQDRSEAQNNSRTNEHNLPVCSSNFGTVNKDNIEAKTKEIEKLRSNIKSLEMKCKGESSLLRTNLKKKNEEIGKLTQEFLNYKEQNKKEKELLRISYEREIQRLHSQLVFKTMDVVVAQSQQEFHPPEVPSTSKDSCQNTKHNNMELDQEPNMLLVKGKLEHCIEETQACQLLLELISPELFCKSTPEVTALDPPLLHFNPRQKNQGTTSSVSLRTCCYTLESCHHLLSRTTKMANLSHKQATLVFLKVIKEILKILEELLSRLKLSTLRESFMSREQEVYEKWQTYLPLNREYRLLDCRAWYDEEKGVEARRSLGLLSILIELSTFVVQAIVPKPDSSLCRTSNLISTNQENDQAINKNEGGETNQVLYRIKDIVEEIVYQRRILSFEGFLTGVVEVLLGLVKATVDVSEISQQIMLDTLKQIVFAKPGSLILFKVFQFLKQAVRYPFITNQLCRNTGQNTCVEYYWEITYTSDTCIIQILCFMIRQLPEDSRHKLTEGFISWLYPLFVKDKEGPPWLFFTPTSRVCQCRSLITQLTVTLLVEVCRKYEKESIPDKRKLEKLLSDGIFLVQNLVYVDKYFPFNIGEYRGNLVLFLDEIHKFKSSLDFHPTSCNISEKLAEEEKMIEFTNVPVNNEEPEGLFTSFLENVTIR